MRRGRSEGKSPTRRTERYRPWSVPQVPSWTAPSSARGACSHHGSSRRSPRRSSGPPPTTARGHTRPTPAMLRRVEQRHRRRPLATPLAGPAHRRENARPTPGHPNQRPGSPPRPSRIAEPSRRRERPGSIRGDPRGAVPVHPLPSRGPRPGQAAARATRPERTRPRDFGSRRPIGRSHPSNEPAPTPRRAGRRIAQVSPDAGTITTRRLGSSPSERVWTPSISPITSCTSLRSAPPIGSRTAS